MKNLKLFCIITNNFSDMVVTEKNDANTMMNKIIKPKHPKQLSIILSF
jgi:hypothetical protein